MRRRKPILNEAPFIKFEIHGDIPLSVSFLDTVLLAS